MEPLDIHANYAGKQVKVYLINGVRLEGEVVEVFSDALLLRRDNVDQSIFYRSVATIMPAGQGN